MIQRLSLLVFLLLLALPARSLELYRLLDESCKGPAGLIIYTDEQSVVLLGLDGRQKMIPRLAVRHILVYNAIENPIAKVHLEGWLAQELREIHLSHGGEAAFRGWPIRFLEELVVYYDVNGKTSLVAIDQIVSIKRPADLPEQVQTQHAQPIRPLLGRGLPGCEEAAPEQMGPDVLLPTRRIGDRIRVSQFFGAYEQGFANLRRFQERTQFYAKPFVFDEETKFGLPLMAPQSNEELPAFFPFYFQWSAGRPYSHQGLTVLGTKQVAWLPQIEPTFVMQTDLKSHFFNATFVGNPSALAAGSDFMVANRGFAQNYYQKLVAKEAGLATSFNYLALSGVDYGPFSLAGGVYYPIYGINAGGLFREVLSTEATPLFRFMFQHPKSSFQLLWGQSRIQSSAPTETDLRVNSSDAMISAGLALDDELQTRSDIEEFALDVLYLRANYDYKFNPDVDFGTGWVLQQMDYSETYRGEARGLEATQLKALFYARQRFGSYVVLQGQLNLFSRDYSLDFGGVGSFKENQYSLVGSIEFIL